MSHKQKISLCWFKPLTAECYPDTLGSEKRVEQAAVKTVLRMESRKDCEQVRAENPVACRRCTAHGPEAGGCVLAQGRPRGGAGMGWEE